MRRIMRSLGLGGQGAGARPAGDGPPAEGLLASGVALAGSPDGTWRLGFEQLTLRNLQLQAGLAAVEVGQMVLKDAELRLSPLEDGAEPELLGLRAAEVQLQGVRVALSGRFSCNTSSAGAWQLDALAGLEGRLHAFITDAAWVIDADVSMTVQRGQIDFNRVRVEHIGPNSSMGISPAGVYIDAPQGGRQFLYLFTGREVPGASFEQRDGRRRVTDRGRLDLQAFVQGLLDSGLSGSFGRAADRHVEAQMDRTRLHGEFRLGDGVIGTGPHRVTLDGQAQGRNRIEFSAAVLSHRLSLRLPEFSVREASFELLGLQGRSGPVSASVRVEASDLRGQASTQSCGPGVQLEADLLTVREVVLGETGRAASETPSNPA